MRDVPRRDQEHIEVAIRPWAEGDLPLLQMLLGDSEMMRYLGGADTPDAIRARHERYLAADAASGALFAIVVSPGQIPVGWAGYWTASWRDRDVWECGWHVLSAHQGRGIATTGTSLMLMHMRDRGERRYAHAFPRVDNAASNALCRRVGFECMGEVDVEYPVGHVMHSNDWRLDLLGQS